MNLTRLEIGKIEAFFRAKPVIRAYVFGSYARGVAINESDVDILVDLDYSCHIGLGFVSMKDELEYLLHKKVDLVSSEGLSPYIAPFVNQNKQLIYERAER